MKIFIPSKFVFPTHFPAIALVLAVSFVPGVIQAETTGSVLAVDSAVTSGPPPVIYVTTDTIDLGTHNEGPVTTFSVEVHNRGEGDLKILNVRASCGCTNVAMDKNDIPPGGFAHLNGGFNTMGHPGMQVKGITISSNDPKRPNYQMSLKCEVIPMPRPNNAMATSVPQVVKRPVVPPPAGANRLTTGPRTLPSTYQRTGLTTGSRFTQTTGTRAGVIRTPSAVAPVATPAVAAPTATPTPKETVTTPTKVSKRKRSSGSSRSN
ncbi:MAG: DUF1573 domain-containing protein [Candidatus Sumerlaeaceae bacterium]|nr:DUF1573 domain-containing protein [Candidatus Sumerlaeaceae bacterium]